jgi:hypothetical protein
MLCFSGRSREGLDEIVAEEVLLLVLMEDEIGGWMGTGCWKKRERKVNKNKRGGGYL